MNCKESFVGVVVMCLKNKLFEFEIEYFCFGCKCVFFWLWFEFFECGVEGVCLSICFGLRMFVYVEEDFFEIVLSMWKKRDMVVYLFFGMLCFLWNLFMNLLSGW